MPLLSGEHWAALVALAPGSIRGQRGQSLVAAIVLRESAVLVENEAFKQQQLAHREGKAIGFLIVENHFAGLNQNLGSTSATLPACASEDAVGGFNQ
jgi:hypothetical protein